MTGRRSPDSQKDENPSKKGFIIKGWLLTVLFVILTTALLVGISIYFDI